jgi:hypothetical protein
VNIRKVIERRMSRRGKGVNAAGDVHAVIAANVGEERSHTHVSSRSRQPIVQRSGRTQTTRQGATMNWPEKSGSQPEEAGGPEPNWVEEESTEPAKAPIDEDVAGSVNAALHDADG